MAKARKPKKPRSFGRFLWNAFRVCFVVFVAIPVLWVALYKFVPPPVTYLMLKRAAEGKGMDYRWRGVDRISPNLVNAAIAAEDARFCQHNGFDFEAIERAFANNEKRPNRIRGGSTISQQTAKNVFLWPNRDWIRKGFETYFTGLIELIWGKRRIMEMYLNVAEMGPGLYGAEAAAQKYFKTSAADLTPAQASRLAAILPNPNRYRAVGSGPYVQRRSRRIGGAAGQIRREGLATCVLDRARRGDAPEPVRAPAPKKAAEPPPPPADPIGEIILAPPEPEPAPPPADAPPPAEPPAPEGQ